MDDPADRHDRAVSSDLRVITINTWKGDGPYQARLRALAEGLSAERPDVVALQESLCTVDGRFSTAEFLADHLGMEFATTHRRRKNRCIEGEWLDSWSGPALLSRWPISRQSEIELPTDPRDGERTAQVCLIEAAFGTVGIVNVHLTHLPDRDDLRRNQLEALFHRLGTDLSAFRYVLCGDFNSTPESETIRWLRRSPHRWRIHETHPTSLSTQATLSSRNPYVIHANLEAHIDYIFGVEPDGYPPAIEMANSRVVLNRPSREGVYPSDHFGVSAAFRFKESES